MTTRENSNFLSAVSAAGTITVSGVNVALGAGDSAATSMAAKVKESLGKRKFFHKYILVDKLKQNLMGL